MALGHWLKDYIGPHSGGSGGGGSEPLMVSINESEQLDHTWQEIYDAVMAGTTVYCKSGSAFISVNALAQIGNSRMAYYVRFMSAKSDGSPDYMNCTASGPDDYPVYDSGDEPVG